MAREQHKTGHRQAVIFDLDGTLTTLEVDFTQLRRELGIDTGAVWEAIVAMADPDRQRAERVLLDAELRGARLCELMPKAGQVLGELSRMNVPCAILTRNCRRAVDIVLDRHGLVVQAVLAREDALMKPDPDGVIELARRLDVDPAGTLVVGDYIFDIQAGQRAGATTVLYAHNDPPPDYATLADYVISDLYELLDIVKQLTATC